MFRLGWRDAKGWARDYLKGEIAVMIAAGLIAASAIEGSPTWLDRVWAGLIGAFAAFVLGFIAVLVVHLGLAPSRLYRRQESTRRRLRRLFIERTMEAAVLAEASASEIQTLRATLDRKSKDQAFADALTERYNEGLGLLNWSGFPKKSQYTDAIGQEWERLEAAFTKGVLAQLEAHGANPQLQALFRNIHTFTLGSFHHHPRMNASLSMFSVRLDRLKKLIDFYSETPILTQ